MNRRPRAWFRLAAAWLAMSPAMSVLADEARVDAAQNLMRLALGMLAVVVLIFGLAWAVRRFSLFDGLQRNGDNPIRNLAQLSVGPKERVVLIEVEGRRLLIGVAPGRITRLDGPDAEWGGAGKDFATHLQASREARKK
ncbi:MAG: flagellar biosynthetic protein FliO [Wenzhouxiangella sp.]|jgi:flagellar protein FliO/FliZ|nr:flagellar biosynthetic protein FliO [Wenzhouxiangella sp.]